MKRNVKDIGQSCQLGSWLSIDPGIGFHLSLGDLVHLARAPFHQLSSVSSIFPCVPSEIYFIDAVQRREMVCSDSMIPLPTKAPIRTTSLASNATMDQERQVCLET